jgi:ABC-2 type transport system permease protein
VSGMLRLTLRQMLGGKKLWLLGLLLSLPVILLSVVQLAAGFDIPDKEAEEAAASIFLYVLYPQSLCILACLLYGASLLAGEIEDKTLVYLFTRAQPRWRILVAKYLVTATTLTVMSAASMTACFLVARAPVGIDLWLAVLAAITGACFAYTAIFALLGLLVPRRAIPVGILYGVVVEFLLSLVPAVVNQMTVSHYLRSVAFHIADVPLPEEVMLIVGGASLARSTLALILIPAIALFLACVVAHRKEWPLTEGV